MHAVAKAKEKQKKASRMQQLLAQVQQACLTRLRRNDNPEGQPSDTCKQQNCPQTPYLMPG